MPVPSKADQEAEGIARSEVGIDPAESAAALNVIDDVGDTGAPPAPQAKEAGEEPQAQPKPKPRVDNLRDEIVARFRKVRTEETENERDDIRDFQRSGMPPEFNPELEPVPVEAAPLVPEDEPPEPAPVEAPPKTIKVKVRGKEVEMPIEDVIAQAQIALAADNYLDEAKGKLNEVNALLRQTRDMPPRAGQDGKHHAAPEGTQPANESDQQTAPEHPEDPYEKLINTIQFGDPADARDLMRNTIATLSAEQVQRALQEERLRDEGARTTRQLADFKAKHEDLASDDFASAAIERRVLALQEEDIKQIIDPQTLPTATPGVVTPADIVAAHRWYRSKGMKVRPVAEILETALNDFLAWRGVKATTTNEPATGKAAPRVDVSVDRTARRQAIPQQPSRTVAPRTDPQPAAQPRDRASIVEQMVRARNAPRRVIGM